MGEYLEAVDYIPAILEKHLPGRQAAAIRDKGMAMRHTIEVTLDSGEAVLVKFNKEDQFLYGVQHVRRVSELLHARGLGAPLILAADDSKTVAPWPFEIEQRAGGTRLDRLLSEASPEERCSILRAVGAYYRGMHAIPGPRSGVWINDPAVTLDKSPVDFYFENDLQRDSSAAVEAGWLRPATREQLLEAWRKHLDVLKDHRPVMVHGSAFHWTIYLVKAAAGWRVNSIAAVGDCLWWDAAFDLAMLRWPPLAEARPADWSAFLEGYGPLPEGFQKRMALYSLLQALIAARWGYWGPQGPATDAWLQAARQALEGKLQAILDS